MQSKACWQGEMAFEVELNGHKFMIDAEEKFGGKNRGPRPKGLLLSALGGCTAMDVISILQKMRCKVDRCEVTVTGELAEDHPKRFLTAHVKYELWGSELPENKVKRAVRLSEETYCGVSATLRPSVGMTSEILVNGAVLAPDTPSE